MAFVGNAMFIENVVINFLSSVNQRQMRLAEYAFGILHDLAGATYRFYKHSASTRLKSVFYRVSINIPPLRGYTNP